MKLAYWMYAGPAHIGVLRVSSSFKNVHAIMHAPLGDDYFNVMRSMLERERDFTPVTASIVDRHVLARGSQEKVVENITRKNKEESPELILLTPTCTSSILQEDLHNFVERSTLTLTEVENPLDSKTSFVNSNSTSQVEHEEDRLSSKEATTELVKNKSARKEVPLFVMGPGEDAKTGNQSEYITSTEHSKAASNSQPDVILADVNHYRVNELQAVDRTLEQIIRFYLENWGRKC